MSPESEKPAVDESPTEETNAFRAYLVSARLIVATYTARLTCGRGSSDMPRQKSIRYS